MIRGPLGPLMASEWGNSVLRIFVAKRVNDFLQLLRSSILHMKDYAALANLVKRALKEVICRIPPHWDTWASCIRKFRVRSQFKWDDVIETANVLRAHDIGTPWDLARGPKRELIPRSDQRKGNQAPYCMASDKMIRGRYPASGS